MCVSFVLSACLSVQPSVCPSLFLHVCVCVCILFFCTYACVCVCMYVCMCVYVCSTQNTHVLWVISSPWPFCHPRLLDQQWGWLIGPRAHALGLPYPGSDPPPHAVSVCGKGRAVSGAGGVANRDLGLLTTGFRTTTPFPHLPDPPCAHALQASGSVKKKYGFRAMQPVQLGWVNIGLPAPMLALSHTL